MILTGRLRPVDRGRHCERSETIQRASEAVGIAASDGLTPHADWAGFEARLSGRLVLFATAGAVRLPKARFLPRDVLLFGAASRGVPAAVHERQSRGWRGPSWHDRPLAHLP